MIRQFQLVDAVVKYDPHADEDLLNKAYVFSMKAHGSQKRASGDPYFIHPLEVAGILASMKLDTATIITALLHDTVEDTDTNLQEIGEMFGPEIASLVDGVTKLTRLEYQSEQVKQAENFRKLFLAMSKDIRVLLVKLADRLHNMHTLGFIPNSDKRRRIARETLEIYSPLAERIGMQNFKEELDHFAFKELYPEAFVSIEKRLHDMHKDDEKTIQHIIEELNALFTKNNMNVVIEGREKTYYSIWRKITHKNISFDELIDIMAFRIMVDNVADCYQALGIIHSAFPVISGRFKDYISTPKANNYRSIHTGIVGPLGQRIEIQIRTHDMHAIAELGVAAHWQYKQGDHIPNTDEYKWLKSLMDILEHASDPEEFLENTKLEMFSDEVFCFTPGGDLISLPQGATIIDFAYAVHSQVGNHCSGARVNGKMVPLRTVLHNGDSVEIITSKGQMPSPLWERFVTTGKARSAIRKFIRTQQRAQYVHLGKEILHKSFKNEGLSLNEKMLDKILVKISCPDIEEVYHQIGIGHLSVREIGLILYHDHFTEKNKKEVTIETINSPLKPQKESKEKVPIAGLIPGMAVHFAGCCHPIPGDRITGIVITGKGVTIHTETCKNLAQFVKTPQRWIDVDWHEKRDDKQKHVSRIRLLLMNAQGALGETTTSISRQAGNIIHVSTNSYEGDFFEITLDIEVRDAAHLSNILAELRSLQIVSSVERV